MLRLYVDAFWISPYSFSAFVALTEKGVPFETVELALHKKENRKGDYPRKSITGLIPCLEHEGFWLAESSAIAEYADEVFPAPLHPALFPKDAESRARARMVVSYLRTQMGPLREDRPTTTMFYEKTNQPLSAKGAEYARQLVGFVEDLVPQGKDSLFGTWSIADAELAFMVGRLVLNGDETTPKARRFFEKQWSRPSVQAFAVRRRPEYVEY